jgi:acetyl esterase
MNNPLSASEFPGTLDPAVETLLASIKSQGFPGWAYLTIEQGRSMMSGMRPLAGEPERVGHVEDLLIPATPDIPARLYLPEGDRPFPVVVYFHAGGWALGTYDDIDAPALCPRTRSDRTTATLTNPSVTDLRR